MTPPGHLACAYLVARSDRRDLRRLAVIALGALAPDLIDKPLQLARLTPYGRTIGHSLFVWALVVFAFGAATGLRLPRARALGLVCLGALSHLLADAIDDVVEGLERTGYVFSAWFGWPYTHPDMWYVRSPHLFESVPHAVTSLELATVALACWRVWREGLASRRS